MQRGASLIEVLASLVILSVGMLGLGKMLMFSLKSNGTAYSNTQATYMANSMLDRMRANRATAIQGTGSAYYLPALTSSASYGAGPNCLASSCSGSTLAAYDLAGWLAGLSSTNGLPNGQGQVVFGTLGAETSVTITVSWNDAIAQQALKETVAPASITLTSVL